MTLANPYDRDARRVVSRYVLIMPVRDEANYLQQTLDAVAAQTVLPVKLIIVDDGSTDTTGEIAQRAAAKHAWIEIIHRPDRGTRSVGPGVMEAFYEGYQSLGGVGYEFLFKIDGDVTFGERYFETLLERFRLNPKLGA